MNIFHSIDVRQLAQLLWQHKTFFLYKRSPSEKLVTLVGIMYDNLRLWIHLSLVMYDKLRLIAYINDHVPFYFSPRGSVREQSLPQHRHLVSRCHHLPPAVGGHPLQGGYWGGSQIQHPVRAVHVRVAAVHHYAGGDQVPHAHLQEGPQVSHWVTHVLFSWIVEIR